MGGSMGGTGYYPGVMGPEGGPGAGQLVQQRTEELSKAVREKWGQGENVWGEESYLLVRVTSLARIIPFFPRLYHWRHRYRLRLTQRLDIYSLMFVLFHCITALGGLSMFGNRTKELAGTAASQIGESAQTAQKAIGETSTGEFLFQFACLLVGERAIENRCRVSYRLGTLEGLAFDLYFDLRSVVLNP